MFIFYDDYMLGKLNLIVVRKSPAKEAVVGLLSYLTVWISDTINMLLFFQFELKMAVHAACVNEKICEVRADFILIFFQEELASLFSAGRPVSSNLAG